ncbi:hypothetical protein [Pseudomonas yamanorum]|uniref:hypothetical protein n=1 Tax=Pseudomonas yamanorum TaxID=515393 RepID=UPI002ED45CBA|nr:hypothetical protein VYI69_05190 [Pseudomonas yamanorum]
MADAKKGIIARVKGAVGNLPFTDYAETLLDSCVENEVLKEIPVISTGVATIKTYLQFKEGKFRKKVEAFVESAGSFTSDEWAAFSETLEKEGKKEKFLNVLLEVIEAADSEEKSKILGGIFRRLVKEEIEYPQFDDQVRFTNDMQTINIHFFMHSYHNDHVLENSLGDILIIQRLAKRKIELATRTINILAQEQEQYIRVSYEITGTGLAYLTSLHQVYRDKIDPEHLYVG